jgi:hypothetical protein
MTEENSNHQHRVLLAGITIRVLYLVALTAALVVAGFVFLENRELHKVLPATPAANAAVLLGQALAVIAADYFLAHKGQNLTDALTESCIILAAIFACVTVLGPHMFLKQIGVTTPPWWKPMGTPTPILIPNTAFYLAAIPSALCFLIVVIRVYFLRLFTRP